MARGRRAKPAEVKALMGNPGRRRLALKDADPKEPRAPGKPKKIEIDPLDWLNTQEKKLFLDVIASLPPNLVRISDRFSFGRWATWMYVFISCKKALEGKRTYYTTTSDHSGDMHRDHPISKKMDTAESNLIALDDRLCLNIVARNNVMHRIFNMPAAKMSGALFGEEEASEQDKAVASLPTEPNAEPDLDPIGFLDRAGKQHSTH
jgi:hypothetical protein